MTRFRHILVPIDFEAPSQEALEVALDLAFDFDAKLTLIHSWEMPPYVYVGIPFISAELWDAVEQAAKERLEGTLVATRKRLPAAQSILATGPAAIEVLAAAERSKVDLIVMGTHGRHGLGHLLLGSVAEKVVRGSLVPVLTVRGKTTT